MVTWNQVKHDDRLHALRTDECIRIYEGFHSKYEAQKDSEVIDSAEQKALISEIQNIR